MIPTGETEVFGENLVHHIFRRDWRSSDPDVLGERPATNGLGNGTDLS
jgi:hypothetical protein